jgi:hypothetical protein
MAVCFCRHGARVGSRLAIRMPAASQVELTGAVTTTFRGGMLADALDELVRAKQQAFWLVGYRGEPKRGSVALRTFAPGAGVAYPVLLPQRSSRRR